MRFLALFMFMLLAIMPVAPGIPDEAVGHVVSVISGDSLGIEMLIGDARTNSIDSIKLADIEAPSTVTEEGKAAQAYAVSLLKNKTVYLDIEDNTSRARNEWSQLICVVYLMDSDYTPMWPPVNRILVDEGHAKVSDDPNDEFNPSDWWKEPASFPTGGKREQLLAMLQDAQEAASQDRGGQGSQNSGSTAAQSSGTFAGLAGKSSVLEKDSTSGRISIGYRK